MNTSNVHSLKDLLATLAIDAPDILFEELVIDSRKVSNTSIFLALSGEQTHGMDYLQDAIDRGALAVVWEPALPQRPTIKKQPKMGGYQDSIPLIKIENLSAVLGQLADIYFKGPSRDLRMIGVTGTNGKSSIAYMIAQAINGLGLTSGFMGSLGYGKIGALLKQQERTTPDVFSVHRFLSECRDTNVGTVAMEVSSHALHQGRVDRVAFDTAVFTNLSRDHLDYHPSMDAYFDEKCKLFAFLELKTAIVCVDHCWGERLMASLRSSVDSISYSTKTSDALVFTRSLKSTMDGITMTFSSPWGEYCIQSPLLGEFNAGNLLAVFSALISIGIRPRDAAQQLARCGPVPGRMEAIRYPAKVTTVIDYSHTPDALQLAIDVLKVDLKGALWVVFGCGGNRDAGKRAMMGDVACIADHIVVTDDNPRNEDADRIVQDILLGIDQQHSAIVIRDRATAIRHTLNQACCDDVVLIAGKGDEDYQQMGDEKIPFSDRQHAHAWYLEGLN